MRCILVPGASGPPSRVPGGADATLSAMGVFADLGEEFEEVVHFHDAHSQLRGIVAIHSTARAADRFALERIERVGRLRQILVP